MLADFLLEPLPVQHPPGVVHLHLAGEPVVVVGAVGHAPGEPVRAGGLGAAPSLVPAPPEADVGEPRVGHRHGLRGRRQIQHRPAAGLEPAAFEQLHGWLVDAGARWGLDAAHRERSGAPRDAAYTWQFALDRLLLGMASGCDDPIAGVVPLPVLEGGAAQALDRLLRMLRVLSRGARV